MTETPVPKLIIKMSIPTIISMLVTSIYNMADTYFVGTLGTSASGAVGVVFGLMAIIQACGFTFGHGAGSVISRKLGAKDNETANAVASISFFASILVGLAITVVGFSFSNSFLNILGSTETILPYARSYAFWILLAAPFMTASFVLNNILRYEGKATLSMIGLVTGGILNIIGDWLLVVKIPLGISGAGIATASSQVISFFILLSMYVFKKTQCKISFSYILPGFKELKNIILTGVPSFFRQGLMSISTMLLNNAANVYGDAAVSGMTIVSRICFLLFAVGLGIGQGFQPVSAFNYGAGKFKRVKKGFFFTILFGEICLSVLAVLGLFFPEELVRFFRDDPEVVEIGAFALKAQLVSMFFQPISICCNMTFQSLGKNKSATFMAALRSGIVFIPALFIMSHIWGLTGVQLAQATTDILAFIITIPFAIIFLKKLPKEDREPKPKKS